MATPHYSFVRAIAKLIEEINATQEGVILEEQGDPAARAVVNRLKKLEQELKTHE